MPKRMRGAFAGMFSGAQEAFGARLRQQISDQAAARNDKLERGRKADELIQSGKMKPQDRDAFIEGQQAGASVQEKLAGMIGGMTKAPSFEQVPSVSALSNEAEASDIPTVGFDASSFQPPKPGGPQRMPLADRADGLLSSRQAGPTSTPDFNTLTEARRQKIASFSPVKQSQYNAETGATEDKYVASNPETLTGQTFQTGPTPEQEAENKKTVQMGSELSPEVIDAKGRLAGTEAGARTQAQQAAEIASSGMTAQQQQAALNLSDNFTAEARPFYIVQDQMNQMSALSKEHTPGSDMGLIFAFNKLLDAMGSVREGEQERVAAAAGLQTRMETWIDKLRSGNILGDEQRKDLLRTAARMYTSATVEQRRREQDYSGRAAQYKIPANLVIRQVAPETEAAAKAAGTSDTTLLRQRQPR